MTELELLESMDIDLSEKRELPGEASPEEDLDAHRAPPQDLKDVFKRYRRATLSPEDLAQVEDSACLREPEWSLQRHIGQDCLNELFECFHGPSDGKLVSLCPQLSEYQNRMQNASIYQSNVIPGRWVARLKVSPLVHWFWSHSCDWLLVLFLTRL